MSIINQMNVVSISHAFAPFLSIKDAMEVDNRPTYGIVFSLGGECVFHTDGGDYFLDKSHVIILPLGISYKLELLASGHFPIVNFNCYPDVKFSKPLLFSIKNVEEFHSDISVIEKLRSTQSLNKHCEIMSIFYSMLSRLSQIEINSTVYPILKTAIKHIENNISNSELTNTELAELIGLSEVYFRRLFKKSFGISPKQYLQQKRIAKAKEMLEIGSYSVSEISQECGYSTINHFSRTFKEKTGYSPNEYRDRFSKVYI